MARHKLGILLAVGLCLPAFAQISRRITAARTGQPIDHVLVMGEGLNWAYSNSDGEFLLPKARFRGPQAPLQFPVTFRVTGYRPLTRIVDSETATANVKLEGRGDADRSISRCTGSSPSSIGWEMRFTLPTKIPKPKSYFDVDYGGEVVRIVNGGKTFAMQTMHGGLCCAGRPNASQYLNSRDIIERAWVLEANGRSFEGMDSRGIAADGTRWRWVGPLLGEMAEYHDATEEAAKLFDSILDSMCIAPKF